MTKNRIDLPDLSPFHMCDISVWLSLWLPQPEKYYAWVREWATHKDSAVFGVEAAIDADCYSVQAGQWEPSKHSQRLAEIARESVISFREGASSGHLAQLAISASKLVITQTTQSITERIEFSERLSDLIRVVIRKSRLTFSPRLKPGACT